MGTLQVTQKLANHVASSMEIELTDELVHQVKRVFLDFVCSAITGSNTEVSKIVYDTVYRLEGEGEYNVIGYEKGLSLTNAAFLEIAAQKNINVIQAFP